ncbi:MAG: gamma-glutamylcyclotransferase [Candidatus Latescibacteria bacterium]|nr:gamma-glutamylcyclotransferase [Candidatus Latescibacterota bacterium]
MNDEGGDPLFVYGTLRDDEMVRQVTGRTFPKGDGTLAGYRRVGEASGFPYPYLVVQEGEVTKGTVLLGIGPEHLARLDVYEGACYERRRVVVATGQGTCHAWVYVGVEERIVREVRRRVE